MSATAPTVDRWTDAMLAAALLCVDPAGTGVRLRSPPGPAREQWLARVRELLPAEAPVRRVPLHITPDRLLGGLDLASTLSLGRPVLESGVLARADGGLALLTMAERLERFTAAMVCQVMDTGEVVLERDGNTRRIATRFGVVALDEGLEPDEQPPTCLVDRLAMHLDLSGVRPDPPSPAPLDRDCVAEARSRLAEVEIPLEMQQVLCQTALALGTGSQRAELLAAAVARASAALAGHDQVEETDAALAARLVLAPRATVLPVPEDDERPEPEVQEPPADEGTDGAEHAGNDQRLPEDLILEAAAAAIPPGLLEQLRLGKARRPRQQSSGHAGAQQQATTRGRPVGLRQGRPDRGRPLNILGTLKAAAPWQGLRRREGEAPVGAGGRLEVRADDFRITRLKHRTETTTVFVVDASGSSALQRLAEAKGAVELLLADCYVRRDQVALIAFRGEGAELLLPPTRSLVRAKRSLAALPGGGGTPLARAIAAASELADAVRRRGQTPLVVFLTDGRANIGRDGAPGRRAAEADALAAARSALAAGLNALLVDTSPRPNPFARELAGAMDARYLPLPYADAATLNAAIREEAS